MIMRFKLKLMSGRLKRKMYGETIEYRATQGHPCQEGEEPKGVVLRVQCYTSKSIILWKAWFQKPFHKYVEYDHPDELSHYTHRSVTVNNNSPIQDYVHPDDHTQPTRQY